MTDNGWTIANLEDRQVELVKEAERTLGADYILVFTDHDGPLPPSFDGLAPANMDGSKLECLQGLESQLGAVAVAYRQAG